MSFPHVTSSLRRLLRKSVIATAATLTFWLLPGHADETTDNRYSITPVPSWVVPIEPATARLDIDAIGGQRHLLVDRQYRDDGNTVAFHQHFVTEISGLAGLSDNSKLSISYDPNYQRLELHSAAVIRDDVIIEQIHRARIEIARTEERSESDLLSGEVTALVVIPDVRVGDQVAVRYTIIGKNPVFENLHHSTWRVRWGVPVERSVLNISVPESMTLMHTPRPEATFTEETTNQLRTLTWLWNALDSTKAERNTTDWHPSPDRLDITAYKSWQQVADWGAKLFDNHSNESDAYQKLSQSIRDTASEKGISVAIAMAIDHVQQDIRYYGVEVGVNSHRPHSPDEVVSNRYGDCKDKALLLVSLLKDLNVDAWPILVSMRSRRGIIDRLPSPGVFDHVVVGIEHEGITYWVDATDNRQSGLLAHRGQPEYGAGLILGKAGESLLERKAAAPELPTSSVTDKLYLSSFGGPVDFVTSTTFRGVEANRFRRELDESGRDRLSDNYQAYYEDLYGKLQSLDAVEISEDELTNTITATASYRLNEFWNIDTRSKSAEFDAYAIQVSSRLDELPDVGNSRKAPLPVYGPTKVEHRIQFFPNIASPNRPLEESRFGINGFDYQDIEYTLGDSFVFESQLEISTDELAPDQINSYNKFRERVLRRAQTGRYFNTIIEDDIALGSATGKLLTDLGELK